MNPLAWLSDWMSVVLQSLYGVTGNYGIAIIFLTVLVKIALYPLTVQSTRQMSAMQKIQPKMEELKTRYKDNPQGMQQGMMQLYKEAGVNPLGGCLPMLLQIPFFLALFFALSNTALISLMSEAGPRAALLWIPTMAKPDPTYLLVVLVGLSTFWSQKTMGTSSPQQKSMMYFMPAFISLVSAPFPAGVQLYWVVSNILTVAQQIYILRQKEERA